jgi:membrane protein
MPVAKRSVWSFATLKHLFATAYSEWSKDEAPRMGASLAYYTILSLAPLLVIAIAIAGFVFGNEAVQGRIVSEIGGLVGTEGARAIETMIRGASGQKSEGLFASLLGVLTLFFGAASVVVELRTDLRKIWKVPQSTATGIKAQIKQESFAFALVIGTGFLLLVSLLVSTAISAAEKFFSDLLPIPGVVLQTVNVLVSLAIFTGLFAVIFKVLPNVPVPWSDVWFGAAVTAILFSVGKLLIGMYLGRAGFGSTFGAAGSLVVVLVWVYYSAQILFFGAELTQVYAREHGFAPNRPGG